MKFIGNFFSWVDPLWEHLVLTRTGQARPRDWSAAFDVESQEYKKAQEAGYDLNSVYWWVYEEKDLGITINPPWCNNKIQWWITKLLPGQFMPMHTDPHTHNSTCNRYWIPLQNYISGHVFIYKDKMMTSYNAGDVYQFENEVDTHGAANIGHTPRIFLLITEYL
jgi:hypothetical protein